MSQSSMMQIFLSHNIANKDIARSLGAQLKLMGADVWFDEWNIRAGDSIPNKLDEGLHAFDTFLLLWSSQASRSKWVRAELEAAIMRNAKEPGVKIIPVRLDETELPMLLSSYKYVQLNQRDGIKRAVMEILGLSTDRDFIKALQASIEEMGLQSREFYGYGVLVACPSCGADLSAIQQWSETDYTRDDQYAGAKCKECGWSGGGEVPV